MCNMNNSGVVNASSSGVNSRIAAGIAQRRPHSSSGCCPYHDDATTTTITTTENDGIAPPPLLGQPVPTKQQQQRRQKCVYGYVGTNFDDAIKPLLLLYLVGSALGTLFFATLAKDGTRGFILSTCGHLLPEVILWTHMLFPPATTRQNHTTMWTIRTIYGIGFLIMSCWPVRGDNKIGPVITATYMILSGVSDFLALWLGLLMLLRRTHYGVRRLGVAFLVHGAAFHLNAMEFFCPNKHQLWWNTDTTSNDNSNHNHNHNHNSNDLQQLPSLEGMGWIVLLVVTIFAFVVGIIPLFKEPLDLRGQSPTVGERKFLVGGVLTSFAIIPPIAAGGPMEALHYLPTLLREPTFFDPKSSLLAVPCKIGFPIMSWILTTHVLLRYVDAGLPILPILATQPSQSSQQQASSSSSYKIKTSNIPKH